MFHYILYYIILHLINIKCHEIIYVSRNVKSSKLGRCSAFWENNSPGNVLELWSWQMKIETHLCPLWMSAQLHSRHFSSQFFTRTMVSRSFPSPSPFNHPVLCLSCLIRCVAKTHDTPRQDSSPWPFFPSFCLILQSSIPLRDGKLNP